MYYEYDKQAALAADNTIVRIAEKGKYIGKFTRAQQIISKTGTEGIDFDFVTNDGARARFTIYTRKSDGSTIYGYKQLMAIMTCLKQRGLSDPQQIRARVWDVDAGSEVEKVVPQFAELLNRPIGLLIHMEQYGDEGKWRPGLSNAFEADTELMAVEILEQKVTPEKLPKALMALKDRPAKNASQTSQRGNSYEAAKNGSLEYVNSEAALAVQDDFDNEPPF